MFLFKYIPTFKDDSALGFESSSAPWFLCCNLIFDQSAHHARLWKVFERGLLDGPGSFFGVWISCSFWRQQRFSKTSQVPPQSEWQESFFPSYFPNLFTMMLDSWPRGQSVYEISFLTTFRGSLNDFKIICHSQSVSHGPFLDIKVFAAHTFDIF